MTVKILNVLNSLSWNRFPGKRKTFSKKLGYRFLTESTKIENSSFAYETVISEANVKINKVVTTKSTYRKERSFASNYFVFLKILFHFKKSCKELICCTNNPNTHICTFCKRWSFIWRWLTLLVSLRNLETSQANYSTIFRIKNATFSGYCFYINTNISTFSNLH